MSVTGAIMAGVGLAGSIGGAAISSHAAGKAADTQAAAADQAAQLQYKASQDSLAFQKEQYNQQQANLAPWLQSGRAGLTNLDYLLGVTPQGGQIAQNQAGSGLPGAQPVGPQPSGGMQPFSSQPGSGINGARPVGPQQYGNQPVGVNARPAVAGTPSLPATTGSTDPGPAVNPALGGFGSLMQPFGEKFIAPTDLTEQNDPGFQARLGLGTDAIQRSAAARGGVLTGGTAKALDTYAQDYASNEYGNVYNRAFNDYANRYNQFEQNQTNQYNRLASLAGVGQTTAGQLATLGNQAAQGISSNLLNTAQNMGQDYQNAGAATASGYVGGANAWSGALNNSASSLQNLLLLKQLQGGGSGLGYGLSGG